MRAWLQVASLIGTCLCLLWPVFSAPAQLDIRVPHIAPSQTEEIPSLPQASNAVRSTGNDAPAIPIASGPFAPFVRDYSCGQLNNGRSCNKCHMRASDVESVTDPAATVAQRRVDGTNVTRAALGALGIKYLQVGGDWWNKCGDGWLNADFVFTKLPAGFVCEDWRTGRFILRQDAGRRMPFEDNTFEVVYSEHMFEHILPIEGATFLKEAYRVLKPGGVLRVITPDLEKYLEGYVHRKTNNFLATHAARFPPMGKLGPPYTAATIVNNIFRNYEHKWIYDFEEFLAVALKARIPQTAVARSSRMGDDLPGWMKEVLRETEAVKTASRQAGLSEPSTRCWLEQEVREEESIYLTVIKRISESADSTADSLQIQRKAST